MEDVFGVLHNAFQFLLSYNLLALTLSFLYFFMSRVFIIMNSMFILFNKSIITYIKKKNLKIMEVVIIFSIYLMVLFHVGRN